MATLILLFPSALGATEGGRGLALLVGVNEYPHLTGRDLEGPANDVALMARVLIEPPFSMDPSAITTLGWPADAPVPTRANIIGGFQRLVREAKPGDQVVILLAGHGSQQPAEEDTMEPDGLDEIFLPSDVKGWDGARGTVENAIVDDEIGRFLDAIRNQGAFVWLIVDACHAGTMARGGWRERFVPPEELVPREVLAKARSRARGGDTQVFGLSPSAGGLVAFYASHPNETAPEAPQPGPGDPHFGMFTYTLVEVLRTSERALTYRELAEEIAKRYRARAMTQPRPLVEGGGIDRLVLGEEVARARQRFEIGDPVARQPGQYGIQAGSLSGLTRGSVLGIHPPPSSGATEPIAHLQLTEVQALSSSGVIVTSPERETPGQQEPAWVPVTRDALPTIPPGSYASLVFLDYGDMKLRVAVQEAGREARDTAFRTLAAGQGPELLERALAEIGSTDRSLVSRVDDLAVADWLVRLVEGEVFLVPASGWSEASAGEAAKVSPRRFLMGGVRDPALSRRLQENLQRIARASHLLSLYRSQRFFSGQSDDVRVEIELLRFESESDSHGTPVPDGETLRDGDEVAFKIRNPSRRAIDITLLYVSADYEIRALFPTADASNRLLPGTELSVYRTRVDTEPPGLEHIVAIAVLGEGSVPRNFLALQQPALERMRTARGGATRGAASPLDALLERALYGEGRARGLGGAQAASYAVDLVSWTVQPTGDR